MATGILAKALSGFGKGVADSAPSVMQIGLEQYRTQILAERDARLQQYQTGERVAGQEFTAEQNRLRQEGETTRQKEGLTHAERLANIAAARAEALQKNLIAANSEKEKLSLLSDSMKTAQKELSETMAALENQPDNKVLLARQNSLMNELNSYRALANKLVSGGKAGESGSSFKSLWSGGESGTKQPGTAITENVNTDRAKGAQESGSMMFDRTAEPAPIPSIPVVKPASGKTPERKSGMIGESMSRNVQDQFLPEPKGGEGIPGMVKSATEKVSKAIRPAPAYVETDSGKKQLAPGETIRINNKEYRVSAPDSDGVWTLIDIASGKAVRIRTSGKE